MESLDFFLHRPPISQALVCKVNVDPTYFNQAKNYPEWKDAMVAYYATLMKIKLGM